MKKKKEKEKIKEFPIIYKGKEWYKKDCNETLVLLLWMVFNETRLFRLCD